MHGRDARVRERCVSACVSAPDDRTALVPLRHRVCVRAPCDPSSVTALGALACFALLECTGRILNFRCTVGNYRNRSERARDSLEKRCRPPVSARARAVWHVLHKNRFVLRGCVTQHHFVYRDALHAV